MPGKPLIFHSRNCVIFFISSSFLLLLLQVNGPPVEWNAGNGCKYAQRENKVNYCSEQEKKKQKQTKGLQYSYDMFGLYCQVL